MTGRNAGCSCVCEFVCVCVCVCVCVHATYPKRVRAPGALAPTSQQRNNRKVTAAQLAASGRRAARAS